MNREFRERRPGGNRPQSGENRRTVGRKSDSSFGERTGRKSFGGGNSPERSFGKGRSGAGDNRFSGTRGSERFQTDRRTTPGERTGSPRSFGERSFGERRGERPAGAGRRTGDRNFAERGNRRSAGYGDSGPKRRFIERDGNPAAEGRTFRTDRPRRPQIQEEAPRSGQIRLNRYIANAGICSRREADTYITAGVVTINGKIVTELGTRVMPDDEVRFDGRLLNPEKKVYLLLNKPKDVVTTTDDPHAERTVIDLVKNACPERIYPVGRLDRNTTGLLLLTNDGDLSKRLTHPSHSVEKVYQVTLDRNVSVSDMEKIGNGIELEDGLISADAISYVEGEPKNVIGIEIHSGRNRIVRRIFEQLGYRVRTLDRVSFAGLTKKNLPRGKWRFLSPQEVAYLKMK